MVVTWANPAMAWHPFQGEVERLLVASCYGNQDMDLYSTFDTRCYGYYQLLRQLTKTVRASREFTPPPHSKINDL